ncbi:hypothetical protein MMC06_002835 [Schaereria dolodes]|nr:hypothetical protein [Schaereria dolodes]
MNTDKDCPLCHHNCKIGRDQPISKFTVEGQAIIREWGVLVRRLKTNIKAHQLNLSVICDTLDYQTAEDIVGPLLELPLLTDCAVRLGQASSHALQRLAENTVLRLTGRPTHHLENSFRFLDLPREIQWQILGHTDLVAPRPIEWVSGHGIVLPDCSFTSAQCTCWRLPTALFQVSKGIHECATRLFFSKNKFKLPTLDWSLDGGDHSCVLRFLAALPRHSLQHIRSLHCVFSSLEDHHLDPDSQAWANWHATAAFMSRHLSLPDLTLTIEDTTSRGGPSVFNLTTGIDDSAETRRAERKLHQRIAEPLAQLQGLRDLFLHFSVGGYGKFETPGEQEETVLEKRIMGEAYDSRAHGKYAEEVQRREDIKRAERPVFGPDGAQIWPLY